MGTTPATMPTNVGGMERIIRIIAGIAILYVGMGMGMPLWAWICLLYTSPSPRDRQRGRMAGSG